MEIRDYDGNDWRQPERVIVPVVVSDVARGYGIWRQDIAEGLQFALRGIQVDLFFVSMSITMMSGPAFATLLTLVVRPVLYAVLFRIPAGASMQR